MLQPQGHAHHLTSLHQAFKQTKMHILPPYQASTCGFDTKSAAKIKQTYGDIYNLPEASGTHRQWPVGAQNGHELKWLKQQPRMGPAMASLLRLQWDEMDFASVETSQQPPGFFLLAMRTILILTEICTNAF